MIIIGDPDKVKKLAKEVSESNLSLEAKSYINDFLANDNNEFYKMEVQESIAK